MALRNSALSRPSSPDNYTCATIIQKSITCESSFPERNGKYNGQVTKTEGGGSSPAAGPLSWADPRASDTEHVFNRPYSESLGSLLCEVAYSGDALFPPRPYVCNSRNRRQKGKATRGGERSTVLPEHQQDKATLQANPSNQQNCRGV